MERTTCGGRRMTNLLTGHEDFIVFHTRKKTIYVSSWSKRENESHIEKYHSFFKWLKRIIQLLYKENTSVLIYKPYKE